MLRISYKLSPTHKLGNILDIVFTNSPNRIHNLIVDSSRCSTISDHFLLDFSIISQAHRPHSNPHVETRRSLFNYSRADFVAIDDVISEIMFNPHSHFNVDNAWAYLKSAIITARNRFVPTVKLPRAITPRWYTPQIRHAIKRTRTLRRRCRLSPTPSRLANLANLASHIQQLMISAKADYVAKLTTTFHTNPRKLYSHLHDLRNSNSTPIPLLHNKSVTTDPSQIAEIFNDYFHSTFNVSSPFTLPPVNQLPTPNNQLSNIHISKCDVYETLALIDTTKCTGWDNIHPRLLKHCAISLSTPVTTLFNLSLKTSSFPSEWKAHKICLIPKKGDLHSVKNYRPITLLPILSKVFESGV